MSHATGSVRSIFYALAANLGIALAKTAAAWVTRSGAMAAEAVHSFADCVNQGLLFLGLFRSRRPADEEHPLGHGKSIYFWSFLVAIMLFSMGGLFSIYEGIHKLGHGGHQVNHPWVAVGVLVLGVVLEGLSLAGALRESRAARRGQNLWRWFRTSRESTVLVVVGEDLAALLGLAMALGAVLLTLVTGNALYDALGSVAIGALLIAVAVAVGIEVKSLLIGESAGPHVEHRVRAILAGQPDVEAVLNLITLQLGPDVMVAVKARMAETDSVATLARRINRCEREIRRRLPQVQWVFFEPDLEDGSRPPAGENP